MITYSDQATSNNTQLSNNEMSQFQNTDDEYDNIPSDVVSSSQQPQQPQAAISRPNANANSIVDADTDSDARPEASRPDASVKACKDIRVIFAHDLSGSMEGSRKQIADGTNEFVQDLQSRYEPPCEFGAKFCLITFSGDTITVGEWADIRDVPVFDAQNFKCHGSTPLWDACAVGIRKLVRDCEGVTGALYVFTDGDDNNSKRVLRSDIREKISNLDPTLHTMLFIGSDPLSSAANADAIGATRTTSLNPSSDDTPSAMRACTNTIARCVTGETQTPMFNDDDVIMSEGHRSAPRSVPHSAHSAYSQSDAFDDDNVPSRR